MRRLVCLFHNEANGMAADGNGDMGSFFPWYARERLPRFSVCARADRLPSFFEEYINNNKDCQLEATLAARTSVKSCSALSTHALEQRPTYLFTHCLR